MSKMPAGSDLRKWYIHRVRRGKWIICPPSESGRLLDDCRPGIVFGSGARALAAFAAKRVNP